MCTMPTTIGLWLPHQRQARQFRGKTSAFAPRKSPFGARIPKFSRKHRRRHCATQRWKIRHLTSGLQQTFISILSRQRKSWHHDDRKIVITTVTKVNNQILFLRTKCPSLEQNMLQFSSNSQVGQTGCCNGSLPYLGALCVQITIRGTLAATRTAGCLLFAY